MKKECNQSIQKKHMRMEQGNNLKIDNVVDITRKKIKEHNPNWSLILEHLYRLLIIGGCDSGKSNAFLNLISHLPTLG